MKNTQVRNFRKRISKPGGTQYGDHKLREASKKKAGSYLQGSTTEGISH